MSMWIDRKDVTGPAVRALVIGVSDYQFLPEQDQLPDENRETLGLHKVDIPATGAFRVAKWLRDSYWHPTHKVKTIRLLLSPSKLELAPANPADSVLDQNDLNELKGVSTNTPAIRSNVETALLDWQDECQDHPEDIALLYIAGHGIQWGDPDDAIVLLEDFSQTKLFLNFSVGIRATRKGMRGSRMPQIQLYFVDSCRIHPDEYKKFDNAGTPLGLPSKLRVEDLGSATIYYAACPQTEAKGRVGRGTYFAEALIDCLTTGFQNPIPDSALPVARTHWHINAANLTAPLQARITQVADRDKVKQYIQPGGTPLPAVFSACENPPPVTIVVDVEPDAAAQVAFAQLWTHDQSKQVTEKAPCWKRPLTLNAVPPGLYLLELSASPPYKTQRFMSVDAQKPPQSHNQITLS